MRGAQSRIKRILCRVGLGVVALYLILLIPDRKQVPPGAGKQPFVWNRDAFWFQLEREFVEARASGCEQLREKISLRFAQSENVLAELRAAKLPAEAKSFDLLETSLFELAPLVAVCPDRLTNYVALAEEARALTKRQSESWDLAAGKSRERLYRMLSGTRMALEEVMLQASTNVVLPEVIHSEDEPSQTPSIERHGVRLHSGDILVSRGGAPTSALIARGNDFPGSFSHVALLHVDDASGDATIIESHIECGVAFGSFEDYLKDKKLRILVLRIRSDLPAMKADPMLPHKAASMALSNVKQQHIPYDFAMNYRDPGKQFCSEVVSSAYANRGVELWLDPTFISSPVVSAWLGSLGVRYFETQAPADLEQDPQLRVVAEWRDRSALLKAHVDDAVTDVMVGAAAPSQGLPYPFWLLPPMRIVKAYSVVLNWFGAVGPIPEGMSATQALRVEKFRRDHEALARQLMVSTDQSREKAGYTPPYWELVRLVKQAVPAQQQLP